jgi:site-specific recombinase XerD
MDDDLRLKGYSLNTRLTYLANVRRFAAHFWRSPAEMGAREIREFLLYLIKVKKASNGTIRLQLSSLRFLYRVTLKRPNEVDGFHFPKAPIRLPDILSRDEVSRLLDCIRSLRVRVIAQLAYGVGLRISEACSLAPTDIDTHRGVIHVRGGKGAKDRIVMLGKKLPLVLREYWGIARPQGRFLFPSRRLADRPIGEKTVRVALHEAASEAGLKKRIYPHLLRHCFATHLLEDDVDIRVIQAVMGHNDLDTTAQYVKVTTKTLSRTRSPLDLLPTKGTDS